MTLYTFFSALEIGLAFALVALGVYLTFRILDLPDLTVDGSFPLGAAVSASLIVGGFSPWFSLFIAVLAGSVAGLITAILHIKLRIINLLASIITMTALYSVNLRVMGGRPNISLLGENTVFQPLETFTLIPSYGVNGLLYGALVLIVILGLWLFLRTEIGLALRATGGNPHMARALGVHTNGMICLGLALSNALVALAGGLYAQAQGSADIGLGVGTIISGLISVIIGEVLRKAGTFNLLASLIWVCLGSIIYRVAIGLALSFDTGEEWYSLKVNDLNLITALLVVGFLASSRLRKNGGTP
jgi:putative ABC transport system permease protein